MEISVEPQGQATVLSITGTLDALTSVALTEVFTTQMDQGNTLLVVDLNPMKYISTAGLRVLLTAVKESRRRGGDLVLAGGKDIVKGILDISGIIEIIKTYPDVERALVSFAT